LKQLGLSKRESCRLVGLSGSSLRYKPLPDRNAELKVSLRKEQRPGCGYRTAHRNLKQEYFPLNPKRVHRLWKLLGLNLKPKAKKRRKGMPMPDRPAAPNQVWCLDFVHDACLNGTKLKILAVVDEFTREVLALEAATSIKAKRVQAVLSELFASRGAPKYLRSDNGPEFIANSLTIWLSLQGTESRFIKPGSPWQNGIVESFNGRLRAEFLNAEVFHNLADAQVKLRIFQRFFNEERRHSSLGDQTPATYRDNALQSKNKEELYS